ncbi:MAG: dihydrodipicolinate synthase family protein [Tannerella sp.]|nr:dihydrodipicolinate synthase family protein [Tannerella sp.]
MKFSKLNGLIAATFTPMDTAGEVDLSIIDAYARRMIDNGVTGAFVCGTTGESTSLVTSERKAIAEAWIKAAGDRLKVIVHAGSNSQKEAIELARHAGEVGAYAVAAIAPSFFKPENVSDLTDFFAPIAAAAPQLPFYYYNMPSMTGVNLSVPAFLTEGKKKMPNLAGVKFTHNNLMEMGECIALNDGEFEVLHGYDEVLIAGLALGVKAGVGSTYNYIPEVYLGIIDAISKNDLLTARKLQMRSIEMVKIIIKYGGGVRGGKAVMTLMGIECGSCRSPFAAFGKDEYESLRNDLKKAGFMD